MAKGPSRARAARIMQIIRVCILEIQIGVSRSGCQNPRSLRAGSFRSSRANTGEMQRELQDLTTHRDAGWYSGLVGGPLLQSDRRCSETIDFGDSTASDSPDALLTKMPGLNS